MLSSDGRRQLDRVVLDLHVPFVSEVDYGLDPEFRIVPDRELKGFVVDSPLQFLGQS